MSTKFALTRDINGYNGFGLRDCDDKVSGLLSLGVAQTVTVPSNYQNWMVVFAIEPGATVWTAINDTAVAPAGAFSATTSEMNPVGRQLKAGDIISLITSDTTAQVGILFYSLGNYS